MEKSTVVITGANRGIGLALSRAFVEAGEYQVVACCRDTASAGDLQTLATKADGRLEIHALDVATDASVASFAASIRGRKVDILINNAGINGGPSQSLGDVDCDAWLNALNVNTVGPMRVTMALLDNLRLAQNAKIATISSQMGATVWPGSGKYIYCSTKAGANQAMRLLARDLASEGMIVTLWHPGWVRTDMGGQGADIAPEESGEGLFRSIISHTEKHNGGFFKWNGEPHAW
ncbi:MAG: SDR family oxidoreductase [Alphaproteobacteria bacterium]|nr:MAG: SDR family oxidoreductase [Alphaproteobacteria bacterium]